MSRNGYPPIHAVTSTGRVRPTLVEGARHVERIQSPIARSPTANAARKNSHRVPPAHGGDVGRARAGVLERAQFGEPRAHGEIGRPQQTRRADATCSASSIMPRSMPLPDRSITILGRSRTAGNVCAQSPPPPMCASINVTADGAPRVARDRARRTRPDWASRDVDAARRDATPARRTARRRRNVIQQHIIRAAAGRQLDADRPAGHAPLDFRKGVCGEIRIDRDVRANQCSLRVGEIQHPRRSRAI